MTATPRRTGVQLIAYADRFGGSMSGLREVLDGPLAGVFEGVHICRSSPP
jgi:sucrose phosphorylase